MFLSRPAPPCGAIKYHITQGGTRTDDNSTIMLKLLCVLRQLPYYVIVMPEVKFLLVLPCIVDNSHPGHEIDYFLGGRVVQVVAALMSPVSVNPLQSQVAIGSSPVSHVRSSVCHSLSRRFSQIVSFTKTDLFKAHASHQCFLISVRPKRALKSGISAVHMWISSLAVW